MAIYDPTDEFDEGTGNAIYQAFGLFDRTEASQADVVDALEQKADERRQWLEQTDNPEVANHEQRAIQMIEQYIHQAKGGKTATELYRRANKEPNTESEAESFARQQVRAAIDEAT